VRDAGRMGGSGGRDEGVAPWGGGGMAHAWERRRLFARSRHQMEATSPTRLHVRRRVDRPGLQLGATLAWNVAIKVGWKSDYRREFWQAAKAAFKKGQIEAVLGMGFTSHHLIQFSREALRGEQNASFYPAPPRQHAAPPPPPIP